MHISQLKFLTSYAFDSGISIQINEHGNKLNTVDGKTCWKKIEKLVADINITDLYYSESLKPIYVEMSDLIKKYNLRENEYNPKYNHFFMQLMDLVDSKSNFKIQLYRILQIAFNAGQLYYIYNNTDELPKYLIDFIDKYNLFNINIYISRETQKLIDNNFLSNTQLITQ